MAKLAAGISRMIPGAVCTLPPDKDGLLTKILVRADGVQIMVEVTPVLRGCVYDPELRTTSAKVQRDFGFAETQVVSWADLYAGKIMAALDRQHPRDLFDVRELLAKEGVTSQLRAAFVVYLLSHHRAMHEVLNPTLKDISGEFAQSFAGMTTEPVRLEDLLEAREKLIAEIVGKMPASHREFLLAFEMGQPDWSKLEIPHANDLPAVRHRMLNLTKVTDTKRAELVSKLERILKA
jgi:hypothetical protein